VNTPRISVVVPFYNNARLARARAAADPRFTLLQTPNGGPGRARNLGVERATGEFLAFVDGDDMLPPHAYETLLHTLESSGSHFVSGAVTPPAGTASTCGWTWTGRPRRWAGITCC